MRRYIQPHVILVAAAAGLGLGAGSCASHRAAEAPAAQPAAAAAPASGSVADVIESPGGEAAIQKLTAVLAMPHRAEPNRARDKYRHPVETLRFFGLRENMTVVELWPGGGWYTEVLAPFLKDKGKLFVTNTATGKKYADMLAANPEVFGKVEVRLIKPPEDINLGPDASADMVVTFRNIHGWMPNGYDSKVYAEAFRVLKSGGIFGVEEHRAKPGADPAELKDTGYVPEDYVIKKVEAAGFKLAGKAEINANPKDTKDYAKGVWTLPPTLRLGDQDKEKYLSIGESDRMTLKFVKP
jgi:predicted methyltransferase